jgi:hypothetical protein
MKLRAFAKVAGMAAAPLLLAASQFSLAAEPAKGNCVAVQKGWAGKTWTRATYDKYVAAFEAGGDQLGDFYAENLFFHDGPGYHGRQTMVDLYKGMRLNMKEYSIPKTVVIDNDQGIIAVELTTKIDALRDTEGARGMKKGDSRSFDGVIFYTLKDGCISDIRGRMVSSTTPGGPGGIPGGRPTGAAGGPAASAPPQR